MKKRTLQSASAQLDTGPTEYRLQSVSAALRRDNVPRDKFLRSLLPFAGDVSPNDRKHLFSLIEATQKMEQDRPRLFALATRQAVVKWVHYTNKIEKAGLSSEGETEAALFAASPDNSVGAAEVRATLKLLKTTHISWKADQGSRRLETAKLVALTKELMESSQVDITDLRRSMAYCEVGTSYHFYPHHSVVSEGLNKVVKLTNKALELIEPLRAHSPEEHLVYTFALAAFAQFHFVDIHPFADGNGRMCRFLSKHILDGVCPLPVPMFADRDQYLAALIDGRKRQDCDAPTDLFRLLVSVARESYSGLLDLYKNSPDCVLSAHDVGELSDSISANDLGEWKDRIIEDFSPLEEGSTKAIHIDGI